MRSYRKLATWAACLALVAQSAPALGKEEAKPKKGDKKEAKGKKKDADPSAQGETAERSRIQVPIQKGHDSKGLRIPYFTLEGRLQMTFHIGTASRLDDMHIKMQNLQVETFDEKGAPEMTIDLPSSVLNVETRELTADTAVTIWRSDFEIKGETMRFNTDTKQGTLAGNVRMLIYNLAEETSQ